MPPTTPPSRKPISKVHGARILASVYDENIPYDVLIENDTIKEIKPHDPEEMFHKEYAIDARDCLVTPSLCHCHVHLDKAFLMSDEKFQDLLLVEGGFEKALRLGGRAKERFERSDLLRRGRWLIAESIAAGVTHMRCFVEVDHIVQLKCLNAGIELQKEFDHCCKIQVCAFAQEPLFSGPHAEENRRLMNEAMRREEIEVVGTTPYVEENEGKMKANIDWAIATSELSSKRIHVDLHLDYNLDPQKAPLTEYVTNKMQEKGWGSESRSKTVVLGHCTRLTLYSLSAWHSLSEGAKSPSAIHFVGLPTSDLFIQGKPEKDSGGGERPRATLQIPQMIEQFGLNGAIAINNVGNAFTPHGGCDPLALASWGVGLYQAGTKKNAQTLFECVSSRAKKAIGFEGPSSIQVGARADLVIFGKGGENAKNLSRQRPRLSLTDLVYDPPKERRVLFGGALVES